MLRQSDHGIEILFIERAASDNDPWSGQTAFPGGGFEPSDRDLRAAAIRETVEETALQLTPRMQIGRLSDQQGSNRNRRLDLLISCFVFECVGDPELVPNYEVADAFWMPLATLTDENNAFEYQTRYREEPFPAVRLDADRILWGLTWRFVAELLEILTPVTALPAYLR